MTWDYYKVVHGCGRGTTTGSCWGRDTNQHRRLPLPTVSTTASRCLGFRASLTGNDLSSAADAVGAVGWIEAPGFSWRATRDWLGRQSVGTGEDLAIHELAEMIAETVGYRGSVQFDHTRPDGMPRKQLDVSRLNPLGWSARIPLREGTAATYEWYQTKPLSAETLAMLGWDKYPA